MGVAGGSPFDGGSGPAGRLGSMGMFGSEGDFGVLKGVSGPDGGFVSDGGSGPEGGADPGGEPGQSTQNGLPIQGSGREGMPCHWLTEFSLPDAVIHLTLPFQMLSPPCSTRRTLLAWSLVSVPGFLPSSNKAILTIWRIQACCFIERLSNNSVFWAILRARATLPAAFCDFASFPNKRHSPVPIPAPPTTEGTIISASLAT